MTKTTNIPNLMRIAACAVLLTALLPVAKAQNGFNMPFSQFGIGTSDLPFTMPMASRMGGAMLTRAGNNYINPFNPASYASIEKESFVFDMGMNLQVSTLRSGAEHVGDADGNIGYLAIGLPVTRWWKLSAGLMPHSSVDYESVDVQTGDGYGTVKTVYDGTGGVNQLFLGSAFNIHNGKRNRLQVGFNVNYLTGRIERAISYKFQGNDSTFYANSRRYKRTRLNNVVFDLGLQAWQKLGDNMELGLGVCYKPYRDMSVNDLALIYTYAADESLMDTIFPARGQDAEFSSRLEQPQTISVGLSLQMGKHWLVAVDGSFASWAGMRYTEDTAHSVFGSSALRYGPTNRYAIGIERIGDMDASTYWGRIGWSLGGHIEQGALRLNIAGEEKSLDSWGIGGGMSMPMRKGRSLLTLSVGYSSLGNIDVLRRDCVTFGIAVSSCERWFVKRKYN